MFGKTILGVGLIALVSCSRNQGSIVSSSDNSHKATKADMTELATSVRGLQSQISSDYSNGGVNLTDANYQKIQNDFAAILKTLRTVQASVDNSSASIATADYISAISDAHCMMNTGNCPLSIIKTTLDDVNTSYDERIQNIDAKMDSAVHDIYVEFAAADKKDTRLALVDSNATLPTSGAEIPYDPQKWNDNGTIQFNTNCYAYSQNLQKERTAGQTFPLYEDGFALQPGDLAHRKMSLSANALNDPTGSEIIKLVQEDAATIDGYFQPVPADVPAPSDAYKVALVIAPNQDYHWYRQNPDGTWSHKPGATNVRDYDSDNKVILDPKAANRGAGGPLDYSWFVGYFAVKSVPIP